MAEPGERRTGLELWRQLGRGAGGHQQVVHAVQPLALDGLEVGLDEILEIGRARHSTSPSRMTASRDSALRVRVFTVPSGMWRYSATSLWDIPLQ